MLQQRTTACMTKRTHIARRGATGALPIMHAARSAPDTSSRSGGVESLAIARRPGRRRLRRRRLRLGCRA
eukprot:3490445-Prymnesium_polylepis.1